MIFHENRLLADDSHAISYLISLKKLGKMSQNLSSAAVVIGALRVNSLQFCMLISRLLFFFKINSFEKYFQEYHQSVKQFGSRSHTY